MHPPQVDQSLFFEVGGDRYVAWPTKVPFSKDVQLLTVIDNDSSHDVTSAWLEDTLHKYIQNDDVIKPEFFATVLLAGTADIEPMTLQTRWGTSNVQSLHVLDTKDFIFGPHIAHNGSLWQVLRLYDDFQKAFLVTLRPTSNDG